MATHEETRHLKSEMFDSLEAYVLEQNKVLKISDVFPLYQTEYFNLESKFVQIVKNLSETSDTIHLKLIKRKGTYIAPKTISFDSFLDIVPNKSIKTSKPHVVENKATSEIITNISDSEAIEEIMKPVVATKIDIPTSTIIKENTKPIPLKTQSVKVEQKPVVFSESADDERYITTEDNIDYIGVITNSEELDDEWEKIQPIPQWFKDSYTYRDVSILFHNDSLDQYIVETMYGSMYLFKKDEMDF